MAQPRQRIVYSAILNRCVTLVSHVEDANEFSDLRLPDILDSVKSSLSREGPSPVEQKFTHPFEKVQVHVLTDGDINYLCITECTNRYYLPFSFLNRVRVQFSEQSSLISRSYTANEGEFDRDFRPVLFRIVDDFNSGRADKMSTVEEQIEDVKEAMLTTVDKMLQRGELLDNLVEKTMKLENKSQEFPRNARQVLKRFRCRNLKLWLVIGVVFAVIVTIVILFAAGVIKS